MIVMWKPLGGASRTVEVSKDTYRSRVAGELTDRECLELLEDSHDPHNMKSWVDDRPSLEAYVLDHGVVDLLTVQKPAPG